MALATIKNVGKRLGGKWALWDVALEIEAGEIMGILGRSGSGKTALARVLAGLDEPTSGAVLLRGRQDDRPFHVSVALDPPASAGELTVYENLDMFGALWGLPRMTRIKEIAFLLELLKLGDARNNPACRLSGGEHRRLEIARALLADSPLTVIDCLLDNLDASVYEKLWDHMLSLRRNDARSFLVLTGSGKVAEVCQKIAVMHRGRIVFVGRADDFRRLAGEDVVVLGDMCGPLLKNRIQEQFSVIIKEEDGFLSFRVGHGDKMVSELLAEFGTELSCVYLKRPTLDDALDVLASGGTSVAASAGVEQGG